MIPVSLRFLTEELLSHFWPLQIGGYTGTSELEDHLYHFENVFLLHQYSNGVKYRVFLMTLVGLT